MEEKLTNIKRYIYDHRLYEEILELALTILEINSKQPVTAKQYFFIIVRCEELARNACKALVRTVNYEEMFNVIWASVQLERDV